MLRKKERKPIMSLMDTITLKAKANQKHVLLPEGSEERTLKAAEILAREGIAKITLLGKEDAIRSKAYKSSIQNNPRALPNTPIFSTRCARKRASRRNRRLKR